MGNLQLASSRNRDLIVRNSGVMPDSKADAGFCADICIMADPGGVKQVIVAERLGVCAVVLLRWGLTVVADRIEFGEKAKRIEPQKHGRYKSNTVRQKSRCPSHSLVPFGFNDGQIVS